MAAKGNETYNLSFLESSRDFGRTSESSSLLQSTLEPQKVGSSQTDQNL